MFLEVVDSEGVPRRETCLSAIGLQLVCLQLCFHKVDELEGA